MTQINYNQLALLQTTFICEAINYLGQIFSLVKDTNNKVICISHQYQLAGYTNESISIDEMVNNLAYAPYFDTNSIVHGL